MTEDRKNWLKQLAVSLNCTNEAPPEGWFTINEFAEINEIILETARKRINKLGLNSKKYLVNGSIYRYYDPSAIKGVSNVKKDRNSGEKAGKGKGGGAESRWPHRD